MKQVFAVFCCLFFCFIISNQSSAQQKFIEVNVTDTVLAQADLFVYKIALLQNDEVEYSELRNKDGIACSKAMVQKEKMLKRIYDSVLHVLKNDKFSFIAQTVPDTFNITQRDYNVYSASILLHSFDSLSLLYNRIKNVKYLVGSVELARASDETAYRKLLYEKLLNEATMKAKDIVAYTNQKITGVQSVIKNTKEKESIG